MKEGEGRRAETKGKVKGGELIGLTRSTV